VGGTNDEEIGNEGTWKEQDGLRRRRRKKEKEKGKEKGKEKERRRGRGRGSRRGRRRGRRRKKRERRRKKGLEAGATRALQFEIGDVVPFVPIIRCRDSEKSNIGHRGEDTVQRRDIPFGSKLKTRINEVSEEENWT